MNTYLPRRAPCCRTLGEWVFKGKPSMLGAASGAVAGLVAITPAAGNVGIPGAFVIGIAAGLVCLWGVSGLKKMIKADDSLDVFGVHAVGGILGALLTGIFVSPDLGAPASFRLGHGQDRVSGVRCATVDPGEGRRRYDHLVRSGRVRLVQDRRSRRRLARSRRRRARRARHQLARRIGVSRLIGFSP